ncbi:MAG: 50S ribosomal protein L29 [Nitrospirae bacterium]|nr:50S ribosomal protein L29 [Nitrospirota bacterium]
MKITELKDLTEEELAQKEQALRKELFNLRFQQATGEIENPLRIKTVKKDIARVLTLIAGKKIAVKEKGKDA